MVEESEGERVWGGGRRGIEREGKSDLFFIFYFFSFSYASTLSVLKDFLNFLFCFCHLRSYNVRDKVIKPKLKNDKEIDRSFKARKEKKIYCFKTPGSNAIFAPPIIARIIATASL